MSTRRDVMGMTAALCALASSAAVAQVAKATSTKKTFVLAHGSWHGGWCWRRVADQLRAAGHHVETPSYSGMGDRAHLLNESIDIETFVQDIVSVINHNDLEDVILVGHSFAGVVITGVADRIPGKLRHLVYLDSLILESGKNSFSMYPPDEAAARIEAAKKAGGGIAVPPPAALPGVWGLTQGTPDYEWVLKHLTAQPLKSYTTALTLKNPISNGISRTYVECTQPLHPVLAASRDLVARQSGWKRIQLSAPHDCMVTHPNETAKILLSV